jgi:hypothetical protein
MNAIDRAKAWKAIRPLIMDFFAKQLEIEKEHFEMCKVLPFSECIRTAIRIAPGRIELAEELPELLDKEFGD